MINLRMCIILVKVLLILSVFFIGLLFLVQNIEALRQTFTLSLNLFGTGIVWAPKQTVPYYYPLIGAFTLGGLFATSFFLLDRLGLSLKLVRQKNQYTSNVRILEEELARVRKENDQLQKDNEQNSHEVTPQKALEDMTSTDEATKTA